MRRRLGPALRSAFAVHPGGPSPVAPAVAADLAATARRRARALAWAGLLVNLPLFYIDDWLNFAGRVTVDSQHWVAAAGIFVWRVVAVGSLGAFLAWERRQARGTDADTRIAGGLGAWFAVLGGWFGAFFALNVPSYALYGLSLLLVAVLVHAPSRASLAGYAAALVVALGGALALGTPSVMVVEWTKLFLVMTAFVVLVDRVLYRQAYRTSEAAHLLGRSNAALEAAVEELQETQTRLVETERHAERLRISRDLHDSVGAQLSSLLAGVDLARLQGARGLGGVEADAREAMRQLRETVWALGATPVSLGGLADRLRHAAAAQARHARADVAVEPGPGLDAELTAAQALHLYRIGQEAIQNALKHSGSRSVRVALGASDGRVALSVADDGAFRTPAHGGDGAPSGFGMRTMRERADVLGGVFEIDTTHGTTVRVSIPLAG